MRNWGDVNIGYGWSPSPGTSYYYRKNKNKSPKNICRSCSSSIQENSFYCIDCQNFLCLSSNNKYGYAERLILDVVKCGDLKKL